MVFKKNNYSNDTRVVDINNMNDIFEQLKKDIVSVSMAENNNVMGYLNQNEVCGKVAVCDVGWTGTMQRSLCSVFPESDFRGFYVATTNDYNQLVKCSYVGDYGVVRPFVHLFENMFLAQHGTTLNYKLIDDEFEPELEEYEYSLEEMRIFVDIQQGALSFVKYLSNSNSYLKNALKSSVASNSILKLGLKPSMDEINAFENLPYRETQIHRLVEAKNMVYYIFHLKKFKEDFYNSGWKIGFLKKIFKINIPYYKLYCFFTRCKETNYEKSI